MNNRTWFIIASIVIIALVVGAYFFFTSNTPTPSSGTPNQQNPFGEPSGITAPGVTGSSGDFIVVEAQNGTAVSIPNIIKDTPSFPIGSHTYYFVTNNQQAEGEDAQFDIVYGTDSSISIGLFKEPLGATRVAAENSLRSLLKQSDSVLCTLVISVAVPYSVNQFYSGQNLGLSFCPGATALP